MNRLLQLAFAFWAPADDTRQAEPAADEASPLTFTPNVPLHRPLAIADAVQADPGVAVIDAALQHPQANRQALLDGTRVAYLLRRARRRSIGFVIGPEGLVVSAPTRVPLREIDAALLDKAGWVVRKLGEVQQRQGALAAARITWCNGAVLPFLGEPLTVVLDPGRPRGATLDEASSPRRLWLGLPLEASPAQIGQTVQAWLQRRARRLFEERLNHHAPLLGVAWHKLALSSASTRWGSANVRGHIRLNWRLMHLRLAVLDYVVVHELAHLRVMDHSPRFWATVGSVMPDYPALRAELRAAAVPKWD